ncbi:MAG: hypothetical protein QW303_00785 [Nitrososphaerota archaeon]
MSKYSHDDRKHIAHMIENLKNDSDYVAIFEILMDDANSSYTQNSNGIFLNLSKISDKTLDKVKKYLRKINRKKIVEIEVDHDIATTSSTDKKDRTYKLSNYEKNILKQRNLKKILNEDNDYEELRLSAKKVRSARRD